MLRHETGFRENTRIDGPRARRLATDSAELLWTSSWSAKFLICPGVRRGRSDFWPDEHEYKTLSFSPDCAERF